MFGFIKNPNNLVRVHSNGVSSYIPGGVFGSFCHFDLYYFPFDIQKCGLRLEVWRYNSSLMHFSNASFSFDFRYQNIGNDQWELVNLTAKTELLLYSVGSFDSALFEITIKRKWIFFGITSIAPCILLGLIEAATFLLKYNDETRLELSFTCLVSYSMFHMLILAELPRGSDRLPLIQVLITIFMGYITLAIALQGICIFIANKASNESQNPSRNLMKFVCYAAALVHIRPEKGSTEAPLKSDWIFIAKVIDRYATVTMFLLLTITPLIVLSLMSAYSAQKFK